MCLICLVKGRIVLRSAIYVRPASRFKRRSCHGALPPRQAGVADGAKHYKKDEFPIIRRLIDMCDTTGKKKKKRCLERETRAQHRLIFVELFQFLATSSSRSLSFLPLRSLPQPSRGPIPYRMVPRCTVPALSMLHQPAPHSLNHPFPSHFFTSPGRNTPHRPLPSHTVPYRIASYRTVPLC